MCSMESFKVYVICSKDTKEIIYVGMTSTSLSDRWWWHTHHSSQYVKTYMEEHGGFHQFSIELLKECETYSDLIEWESHFILEIEPKCNERWHEVTIANTRYEVSSFGNLRNGEHIIKQTLCKDGYKKYIYFHEGRLQYLSIHRLVAGTFIPNPDKKRCVDHINRIRSDNRLENLRWATHQENSLNTKVRQNSTSDKNIYLINGKYNVQIYRKYKKFNKLCNTLTEAIKERDKYLASLDSTY